MNLVDKTKNHCLESVKRAELDYDLGRHLDQIEKWAIKLLQRNPKADKEVVMLAVWLHDIGQVIGDQENDHAVNSETEAKRFLREQGASAELVNKVAHCVRAHRCKDINPNTLEAKLLAVADSVSHMTGKAYIDVYARVSKKEAIAKLERDFRDIAIFPDFQKEIKNLYQAWKNLLELFPTG